MFWQQALTSLAHKLFAFEHYRPRMIAVLEAMRRHQKLDVRAPVDVVFGPNGGLHPYVHPAQREKILPIPTIVSLFLANQHTHRWLVTYAQDRKVWSDPYFDEYVKFRKPTSIFQLLSTEERCLFRCLTQLGPEDLPRTDKNQRYVEM